MESENRINQHGNYSLLIEAIQTTYQSGLDKVAVAINMHLVLTYWQIGQYIVAFEQKGNSKAQYGKGLLEKLSKDLSLTYGKGFSLSNIKRMRQFYAV